MIKHYDDIADPRALVETPAEMLVLHWYKRAIAAEDALRRMTSDPASTPDRELLAVT